MPVRDAPAFLYSEEILHFQEKLPVGKSAFCFIIYIVEFHIGMRHTKIKYGEGIWPVA